MGRLFGAISVLALLVPALGASSCAKKIIIQGVEYDYEEVAAERYAPAREALAAGEREEASRLLEKFLADFPESELAADALFALGRLALEAGRQAEARDYLGRLLLEHPGGRQDLRAKFYLGRLDFEEGNFREALLGLKGVAKRLKGEERVDAISMVARAYHRLGSHAQAVRWYSRMLAHAADQRERSSIEVLILDLIDRQIPFREIRRLAETSEEFAEDRFTAGLLRYKMARVYFHTRDYARSEATLRGYLRDFGDGPYAKPARELLNRMEERRRVDGSAIGLILPLSGKYREYGERVLQGVLLGAALFEEGMKSGTGPVTGKRSSIKLHIRDSAADPDKAAEAVEELTLRERVIAIIGPIFSNTALAAAHKAEELGVPLIALSRRERLTEIGPYIFRNCLTNSSQVKALVDFSMERLGFKSFAILFPNHPYGVELANLFWEEAVRRKGVIVGAECYEPDQTTFDVPVRKLVGRYYLDARKDLGELSWKCNKIKSPYHRRVCREKALDRLPPVIDFDAIFIPDYPKSVAMLTPAIAFQDIETTDCLSSQRTVRRRFDRKEVKAVCLLGANGWNSSKVVEQGGKYVRGAVFVDGFFRSSPAAEVQDFLKQFGETFGREPSLLEAQGYDTARLMHHIMEKTHPADREALRRALVRVRAYPGVTGRISFTRDGEVEKDLFLLTIDSEGIRQVNVDEIAPAGVEG